MQLEEKTRHKSLSNDRVSVAAIVVWQRKPAFWSLKIEVTASFAKAKKENGFKRLLLKVCICVL